MNLDGLGDLTPDPHLPERLVSAPIEIPYFPGAKLRFELVDVATDAAPQDFIHAVANIRRLTLADRDRATPHVFATYKALADALGDEILVSITTPNEVWRHVRPTSVLLERAADGKVNVRLYAECAWDPEHGLLIVYREGQFLAQVGDQSESYGSEFAGRSDPAALPRTAELLVADLAGQGLRLDYSPASLEAIDRILANYGTGKAEENLGLVELVGAYFGEVLRRNLGGEWHVDVPPDGATGLKLPDHGELTDVFVWCHAIVYKQLRDGNKSLVVIYADIARRMGS